MTKKKNMKKEAVQHKAEGQGPVHSKGEKCKKAKKRGRDDHVIKTNLYQEGGEWIACTITGQGDAGKPGQVKWGKRQLKGRSDAWWRSPEDEQTETRRGDSEPWKRGGRRRSVWRVRAAGGGDLIQKKNIRVEASSFHEADERLEEESHCSQHAHRHKNPEEDPVDDHRHVLPVVLHLQADRVVFLRETEKTGKTHRDKASGLTAQSWRFITKSLTTAKTATFTSRHCVATAAEWLWGQCVSARLCLYVRGKNCWKEH